MKAYRASISIFLTVFHSDWPTPMFASDSNERNTVDCWHLKFGQSCAWSYLCRVIKVTVPTDSDTVLPFARLRVEIAPLIALRIA